MSTNKIVRNFSVRRLYNLIIIDGPQQRNGADRVANIVNGKEKPAAASLGGNG